MTPFRRAVTRNKTLPVPARVRRLARVLDLGHVAPGIGPRAVEVREAVHPRCMVVASAEPAWGNPPSYLHIGLARPVAMYIVLPCEGRPTVYRGAVYSYREVVEEGAILDRKSWTARADRLAPLAFFADFLR